jgi:hypothetical protein
MERSNGLNFSKTEHYSITLILILKRGNDGRGVKGRGQRQGQNRGRPRQRRRSKRAHGRLEMA